jgi:hypothetical protein
MAELKDEESTTLMSDETPTPKLKRFITHRIKLVVYELLSVSTITNLLSSLRRDSRYVMLSFKSKKKYQFYSMCYEPFKFWSGCSSC